MPEHAETVSSEHTLRTSSSYARSYFDKDGTRRQENVYRVRVKCDCGFTADAPVHPVDEITAIWRAHTDGHREGE